MTRKQDLPRLEQCRERALTLVSQRPHTRAQLRTKLLRKGFANDDIEQVVEDFIRTGLVDDRRLAFDYCQYMKSASPPVGRNRVIAKLRSYGVAPDLIQEAILAVWDAAGDDEEVKRATAAAGSKLRLIRDKSDPKKVREKLYRFLAGKGFAGAVCSRAIEAAQTEE